MSADRVETDRVRAKVEALIGEMRVAGMVIGQGGVKLGHENEVKLADKIIDWANQLREALSAPEAKSATVCEWPGCQRPAFCCSGNFGGRLVCREHFRITNGSAASGRSRAQGEVIAEAERLLKDITPGDWQVAPCSDTDETRDVVAGYQESVQDGRPIKQAHWIAELDVHMDFDSDRNAQFEELEANAAFIAAAPRLVRELLALLASPPPDPAPPQWQPIETAPKSVYELMRLGAIGRAQTKNPHIPWRVGALMWLDGPSQCFDVHGLEPMEWMALNPPSRPQGTAPQEPQS